MIRQTFFLLFLTAIILITLQNLLAQSFQWGYALPEEQGFSTEKLYAMRDTLAFHGTQALLVIRNDQIILEWYSTGWHPRRRHYTASLAKALVGGMSLLLAINDGRLQADDYAWKYVPQWKDLPRKSKITVAQLATHSSGIEDSEITEQELAEAKLNGIEVKDRHMDIPGWKGGFWRQEPDPFTLSRDKAPVLWEPGTEYHYSNPGMAMLSYVVTASYKGTSYRDIRTLLQERIMDPIGINEDEWSIGYGKTFQVDELNLVANWGGGNYTPRAVARVGRLMLYKGEWESRKLLDSALVDQVLTYQRTPLPPRHAKQPAPAATLGWYNNFDGIWPKAPRHTFLGAGAGNQILVVMPELNLIIVRNGNVMYDESRGEGFFYGVEKYLINMLMNACVEPSLLKSEVKEDVEFDPVR